MEHIAAGVVAVASALVAIISKSADLPRRLHVRSGLTFVGAMVAVVATALVLSLLRFNPIMVLIALFSGYSAWAGYRFARNRGGTPTTADRAAAWALAIVSLGMIGWGVYGVATGALTGVIGIIFGIIGGLGAKEDLNRFSGGGVWGRDRIMAHANRMLGATIATVTAVMVTNVRVEPLWIPWLAPTIVLVPAIAWWERRLRAGVRPRGMPTAD
jgi:hypothetical protein